MTSGKETQAIYHSTNTYSPSSIECISEDWIKSSGKVFQILIIGEKKERGID